MLTRSLSRRYHVPVPPAIAWDYLTDPVVVAAGSNHPVLVAKTTPGFEVGTRWDEIHDDACDFDSVPWVVLAAEPERSFTIEGLQSGARQRVTNTLAASDSGTDVTATIELRPSVKAHGTLVERAVLFLICLTGLGMSIVAGEFEESVDADREAIERLQP